MDEEFSRLESKFRAIGCDVAQVAFCNDSAFLEAEARDPALLEDYAALVSARPIPAAEEERARRVVDRTARFLFERLAKNRKLGACIDASLVLSEFLNRQGVWNYVAKGATSVFFPAGTIPPNRLQPLTVPTNPAVAGHLWVVAPPFDVVDVTIFLQPYSGDALPHVPHGYVAVTDTSDDDPEPEDFLEAELVLEEIRLYGREPTLDDIYDRLSPGLRSRVQRLGCRGVQVDGVRLRYVGCGVGGNADPLEEWRNLEVDGLWPIDLWRAFARETGVD